jgi:16S rRNA (cytosine967-C5)-methyltransferase
VSAKAGAAVSPARQAAFDVVRETFERGAFTERSLRRIADERGLRGRDRAQAQRLAYGSVQRRGTADAAIRRLAERPPERLDPPVAAALRVGLYELLFADATPDRAAVHQAVELAKGAGAAHASGLVNAVLRRAAREREPLTRELLADDSTPERAAVAHSAPPWLARLWWEELGAEGARSLLAACNRPAEVALRASGDRDAVLAELRGAGAEAVPASGPWPLAAPEGLVLSGQGGDAVPRLVASGALTPQSRGSMAAVEVLGPQPGEHLLDLCAGPGIKAGQIAARSAGRGEVICVEIDPERAAEVSQQAARLGLRNVTVVEADAAGAPMAPGFDRVLVDAPCSDLGALASRPDARWRKSPRAIERLAEVQAKVLRNGVLALRPGGVLVYSTCTISRRENEDRVAALLEDSSAGELPPLVVEALGERAPALASPRDSRCLQVRPDRDRTTGFFICRLRRDD